MIVPAIATRIEQPHGGAGVWVVPHNVIAFVEVARSTRQRQVAFVLGALLAWGNGVFDLEGEIENGLRRMAVFAAVSGAPSDQRMMGVSWSQLADQGGGTLTGGV